MTIKFKPVSLSSTSKSTTTTAPAAPRQADTPGKLEADQKLLASLNRPAYEQGHAKRYAEGPSGPQGLAFRANHHLQDLETAKKGKDTDALKGALRAAHADLDALAKQPRPDTLDGALDQAKASQAILEKALAGMGKAKGETAKPLEHMLEGVKTTVARIEDQKVSPLKHLDGSSALIANAYRNHAAQPSYAYMTDDKAMGKDAQAYANRQNDIKNSLWRHSSVKRTEGVGGMDFIRELSGTNIRSLEAEIERRGGMTAQDKEIFKAFMSCDYILSHSTSPEGKGAIDNSRKILSKIQLQHQAGRTDIKNNTPGTDEKLLRNNDFVFFRFEAAQASDGASRYGTNTYRYEARQTPLFQTGWITMEDQLTPKVLEALKRKGDTVVRKASQEPNPGNEVFNAMPRVKTVREYPKTEETLDHQTHEQVFFGPDIPKGVALSVIAELKRISDPKYNKEMGLAERNELQKFIHLGKESKPVTPEMAHKLLKSLFRPEAKLPKTFFLPREQGTEPTST
ncbi:hypothetical protein [Corallococcus sp. AS-1-6]|uniref:hypothetical protein n=1 Tax=Corallococcus sp. AS-1-6 TaxID=2874599 RepID=UPI001CC0E656|nr:hypothetical protein [Corallococcus sp. AS-1-6]MBZ4377526.1 hypothetical protein [Corallococcus sp. AS-1-6]